MRIERRRFSLKYWSSSRQVLFLPAVLDMGIRLDETQPNVFGKELGHDVPVEGYERVARLQFPNDIEEGKISFRVRGF